MRYEHLYWLLSCLVAVTAIAKERPYEPPRLETGQVDLQGVWAHTNLTPLQRAPEFKQLIITPAEAAQIEAKIAATNDDLTKPAEPSLYFDRRTVERVRGELRSSIIVEPADGMIPGNALFREKAAEAGKALLTAFDGPEQRPTSERCLASASAGPPVVLVPATDLRQIVQTPQAIVLASEELHEARVIRMNARHAPSEITSWVGDSIGWWEGGTLVVETTHFAPTSAVRMAPNSLFIVSSQTVVVERITRVSENELSYEFTVTDPTYYTQPWRGETRFHRSSARMLEYACHEGNYSLGYGLQGARAQESDPATPAATLSDGNAAGRGASNVGVEKRP